MCLDDRSPRAAHLVRELVGVTLVDGLGGEEEGGTVLGRHCRCCGAGDGGWGRQAARKTEAREVPASHAKRRRREKRCRNPASSRTPGNVSRRPRDPADARASTPRVARGVARERDGPRDARSRDGRSSEDGAAIDRSIDRSIARRTKSRGATAARGRAAAGASRRRRESRRRRARHRAAGKTHLCVTKAGGARVACVRSDDEGGDRARRTKRRTTEQDSESCGPLIPGAFGEKRRAVD